MIRISCLAALAAVLPAAPTLLQAAIHAEPAVARKPIGVEQQPGPAAPSAAKATPTRPPTKRKLSRQARLRQKILEQYDENKNGKLDPEERKKLIQDRRANARKNVRPNPLQQKLLKEFDKNGDGKLDAKEQAAARQEILKRRQQYLRKLQQRFRGRRGGRRGIRGIRRR